MPTRTWLRLYLTSVADYLGPTWIQGSALMAQLAHGCTICTVARSGISTVLPLSWLYLPSPTARDMAGSQARDEDARVGFCAHVVIKTEGGGFR
jgi:hypothetical protein